MGADLTGTAPSFRWPVAVLLGLLVLPGLQAGGSLVPDEARRLKLQGGQSVELGIAIAPTQPSFVTVEQISIDVVLTAVDASGETLLISSAAGERNAQELMTLPPQTRALRIAAASPSAPAGTVDVALTVGDLPKDEQLLARGHRYYSIGRRQPAHLGDCGGGATTGFTAAAQCYARAAALVSRSNAYPLFLQADAVRAASDYDKAVELYARAETAALAQAKTPRKLETLGAIYAGWGWSLSRQGNYDQARGILRRAVPVIEDLVQQEPDHQGHLYDLGSVQNNLCLQDLRQDKLQDAADCLDQLEALASSLADDNLSLLALNGLGGLHKLLGQPDEAIEYFERALVLATNKQDRRRQALLHNNLGWTYRSSSEYAKGIQHALKAVSISDELEWSDQTALAQANLGRLYALVGDYDRARHWYNVSIQGSKQARRLANRYLSLGQIEMAESRYDEALQAFSRARDIVATLEAPKLHLAAADRLIRVQLALGNNSSIAGIVARAQAAAALVEDRFSLASYDLAVGDYHLASGDFQAARVLYERALPTYQELGFSTGIANTYYGLARCALQGGKPQQAIRYAALAIDNLEATRERLWTLFERINFNRIGGEIYSFAVDLHMADFRLSGRQESALQAMLIAERRKAQTLSELVGSAGNEAGQLAETAAPAAARRRVAALQTQLLELSDQPERKALVAQLKSDYFVALDELQAAELLNPNLRSAGRSETPLTVSEIQQLVANHQNVISIFVGPGRSYAWRWSDEDMQVFDLPGRGEIDEWVSRVLRHFRAPSTGNEKDLTASPVMRALWPVLRRRSEKPERLLIAADGALSLLPFSALPMADGAPLITHTEVTLSPGLGVTASAGTYPPATQPSALVLADPVFSPADRRLGTARRRGQASALALPRLAGTRAEAAVLEQLIPASQLVTLSDLDATRENLLGLPLRQFSLLHFGTHGLLDRNTPDGYGLAMTRLRPDGSSLDWLLNIHDISRLNLNADLVVLSGCDTAQGEQIDGAGIVGLTRAFMYAGSRQVMSSLWQVSDRSTGRLMQHFYRSYLADNTTAAAALRQAQLTLAKQPGREHPYHWAGFVVSAGSQASQRPN